MWIGWLELDLLLGDVRTLKEKRSVVRPLIAELHRRFQLSVAEVGHLELHRRASIGVSVVSADRRHAVDMLDQVERSVSGHPELQMLSAHRGFSTSADE
ncbi:MAG: DUF503 domain-containing protein [Leifsonia flava]